MSYLSHPLKDLFAIYCMEMIFYPLHLFEDEFIMHGYLQLAYYQHNS
jgi:hypothetical protein